MNCRDAYELLLEADATDLRGEGDTPLAGHLRSCGRCAVRAAAILGAQARLADYLAARHAATPTDSALAAAAAEARRRRKRRRVAARVIPTLAAAAVAGILIARNDGVRSAAEDHRPAAEPPSPTVAQTPSHQNVVVYETDNPNILIVWLY